MAITFIEREGLDAEGLYRVPGNRAHVDLLFQHFDEDPMVDIDDLDIAVNAVATAVKDFFFKRLPPILEDDHMAELETISCELFFFVVEGLLKVSRFKMSFSCLQIFQKTNEIVSRISAIASKKRSNQKNKGTLYR